MRFSHRPDIHLDDWPPAIQRRVLQSQLAEAGVAPDFDLIESLRHEADCFVSIGTDISVARDASGRWFCARNQFLNSTRANAP